jgi:manganese-dependent inorganic pyrophosphatase
MAVYAVGHKNPDTDTVATAIGAADYYKKKAGMDVIPVTQGPINPESKFVLGKFGIATPEILTDATDKKIILVDHTDLSQSLENLAKGEIVAVIDHHKLGDVTTPNPLEMWVWPWLQLHRAQGHVRLRGIEIPSPSPGSCSAAYPLRNVCSSPRPAPRPTRRPAGPGQDRRSVRHDGPWGGDVQGQVRRGRQPLQ